MSLCIAVQSKDSILVGADTAVTIRSNTGENYRNKIGLEKLYQVGNLVIFICGNARAGLDIINIFKSSDDKRVENLQKIIRTRYQQLVLERPSDLEHLNEDNNSLLNVCCFGIDHNGISYSYTLNPTNNFKLEKWKGVVAGSHLIVGGFASKKAESFALDLIERGVSDAEVLIGKTFKHASGADVGGELLLYKLDRNGITRLYKRRINEVVRFPMCDFQQEEFINADLVGGTITGTTINGVFINGSEITGGRIKSNTDIDVTRDVRIGNNLELNGENEMVAKSVQFTGVGSVYGDNLLKQLTVFGQNGVALNGGVRGAFVGSIDDENRIVTSSALQQKLNEIWDAINKKANIGHTHTVVVPNHNHGNPQNQNSGGGTFVTS